MKLLSLVWVSFFRERGRGADKPKYTCIGSKTSNCDSNMIIYSKHFLLVRSQFSRRALQKKKLRRANDIWNSERAFKANKTEWVLDRKPTAADPCLTASRAYST